MENNKPDLGKPRADMSIDVERRDFATRVEREANHDEPGASPGRLEDGKLEFGGGGALVTAASTAAGASSDAVYTARHLFNVSPTLYAKHSMDFLILRITFALVVLGIFASLVSIISGSSAISGPNEVTILFSLFMLYCTWRLHIWPYAVSIFGCIFVIGVFYSRGVSPFEGRLMYVYLMLGMFVLSAIATWKIHESLIPDDPKAESDEQAAPLPMRAAAEDMRNQGRSDALPEAAAPPLAPETAQAAAPPDVALAAELQTTTGQAVDLAAELQEEPQEEPRTANRTAWLIPGLAIVVAAGAIIACLHFYQQNQRLEAGLQPVAAADANTSNMQADASAMAADVKTFNLQCGVSVSLPRNWVVSTIENDSSLLTVYRYDDAGLSLARLKIISEKIEHANYSLMNIKSLNAKEQSKLTEKMIEGYESPEVEYITNISNRRVVGHRIIDLNGFFTISLTTKGNRGQYKVTEELRCIFFSDHLVSIGLLWGDSAFPLLSQEIAAILNSITPGRE